MHGDVRLLGLHHVGGEHDSEVGDVGSKHYAVG